MTRGVENLARNQEHDVTDYAKLILPLVTLLLFWYMFHGFEITIGISPKTIAYIDTCVFSLFAVGVLSDIIFSLTQKLHSARFETHRMRNNTADGNNE